MRHLALFDGGRYIPEERRVSGIVLAGVLDYYAKVWGKIAEADLKAEMKLDDIFVGSWYPLENLAMILRKIWQETPSRMRLAGEHTSKLIGDERRYERKFYTPEQMLQETRDAWSHSFNFGEPAVELIPGQTLIKVPREPFLDPYWQDFLKGGIHGMLSQSKAIESEITIESKVDERNDVYVFVFRPKKRPR
jgi:hypothetical protein